MFRIFSKIALNKRALHLNGITRHYTTENSSLNTLLTSLKKSTPENDKSTNLVTKTPMTFAQMFKQSQFVNLGDLKNKFIIGKIVDVVGDDLYIDYGGKFNCVCKIPVNTEKSLLKYEKYF